MMTEETNLEVGIAQDFEELHVTIIQPPKGLVSLGLKELWEYWELLYFLTWRDIKVRYKQTLLGGLWAILQPFCMMVVFSLFFGKLAQIPSDGVPYPIFAYAGLLPWTFFSKGMTDSANSLVGSQNLITKVYFPRLVIPISSVLSGVVDFFGTIGNIGKDGTQQGNDHKETRFGSGNHMWHSDSSFRQVPTMVTITYAHEVPDEGGQTEFVSCRAAYAGLPDAMKAEMDGLVAIHDYVFSRSKVAPVDPSHAASLPPVEQRLVRTNPSTGARNYFVGSHARSIVGWDEAASRNLIEDLMARATREQNILSHTWRPGDLVIWDNRCLLHRGRPYDADRYRRYIRQNRVCGVGPTLEE